MSTLNPSPLPDASSSTRGAVSTLAQSFAGIKTFVNAVILSAGLQITGVLASQPTMISIRSATSTAFASNGDATFWDRLGGATTLHAQSGITNSIGKAIVTWASTSNTGLTVDDSSAYFVIGRTPRASIDAGTAFTGSTSLLTINIATYEVLIGGSLNLNGATGSGSITAVGPISGQTLQSTAANSWNTAQRGTVTALTSSSGAIAINLATSNNFSHALTENTTLAAPSNATAGQSGCIVFTQHASSPKTLAFNSFWKFAGGTVPTLTATNSAVDVLTYYVCSSGFAVCQLIKGVA